MAGAFELYQDNGGTFRFRLKAGNGQIGAVSEAYESEAALSTASSVRTTAPDAAADGQT